MANARTRTRSARLKQANLRLVANNVEPIMPTDDTRRQGTAPKHPCLCEKPYLAHFAGSNELVLGHKFREETEQERRGRLEAETERARVRSIVLGKR